MSASESGKRVDGNRDRDMSRAADSTMEWDELGFWIFRRVGGGGRVHGG